MKTIRLHGIAKDSIVDGLGLRLAIFTQGCPHACEGCHNPQSHAMDGGREWNIAEIQQMMCSNPLLDGITLSGGEPFMQPQACWELATFAHSNQLSVWAYTGFTYEMLKKVKDDSTQALLNEIDVLVDGPFVLAERSLDLVFCGSRNQRVIDMKQTRTTGKVTLFTPPSWDL